MISPDLERFDLEAPNFQFPASIIARAVKSEAAIQRAIQSVHTRAGGMETASAEDLFTWSALISNQRLDSWFTKMSTSSLKNYAADALEGVAFLNSHKHFELPVGYSVNGVFEETGEPAESYPRVLADFYTVRGLNLNGLQTDHFIKGIEHALIRDVSIGFKEGEGFGYTCSVCGQDFWSWDCSHVPGVEYDVAESPGEDPGRSEDKKVLAFAWVENARLSEVSAVYDGATPDAMVVKATRESRGGRLKPDVRRMLESKYRMVLPKITERFNGTEFNKSEEIMSTENKDKTGTSGAPDNNDRAVALAAGLRSFARGLNIPNVQIIETTTDEAVLEAIRTEFERLRPFEAQAAEGQKLRKALIEDAIKEGVRAAATPEEFDVDARTAMLEGLSVDVISEMRSAWKGIADAKLAGKTRTSQDAPAGTDGAPLEGEDPNADEADAGEVDSTVPEDASGGV